MASLNCGPKHDHLVRLLRGGNHPGPASAPGLPEDLGGEILERWCPGASSDHEDGLEGGGIDLGHLQGAFAGPLRLKTRETATEGEIKRQRRRQKGVETYVVEERELAPRAWRTHDTTLGDCCRENSDAINALLGDSDRCAGEKARRLGRRCNSGWGLVYFHIESPPGPGIPPSVPPYFSNGTRKN